MVLTLLNNVADLHHFEYMSLTGLYINNHIKYKNIF